MSDFNLGGYAFGNPKLGNTHKIEKYVSPLLPITANTDYLNNSFNGVFTGTPDVLEAYLIPQGNQNNYVSGYKVKLTIGIYDGSSPASVSQGLSIAIHEDNDAFDYYTGVNGIAIFDAAPNNWATISPANWRLQIIATRFVVGDNPDITRVGSKVLEEVTVSNGDADVRFNLQQYFNEWDEFEVSIAGLYTTTDGQYPVMRVSEDGGATFISSSSHYESQGLFGNNTTVTGARYTAQNGMLFYSWDTGTASVYERMSGTVRIRNANSTESPTHINASGGGRNSSGLMVYTTSACQVLSTNITTDIQILPFIGNLGSGVIKLIGIRRAV